MITLYWWATARKAGQWLDADALRDRADELRAPTSVLWIDLEAPDPAEEGLIFHDFYPLHPLTVEDITRLRRHPDSGPHFPKVEEFPDYLFVVLNPLSKGYLAALAGGAAPVGAAADGHATQLSAVLTDRLLITHHYEPMLSTRDLHCALGKNAAQAERGPAYLFHLILHVLVDQYAPVLDGIDDALDQREAAVLRQGSPEMLRGLLDLKRQIVALRKTLVYEREVLARLARGEFGLIGDPEMAYYRNVYDHLVRFTELVEASREMASDLMQTHLAAVSNRLNEIMKVLAMISTIILPMTLISGIYGMNFEHMPELGWAFGYPLALGAMALTALTGVAYFRWKKWF
jgi:magnesium transporter